MADRQLHGSCLCGAVRYRVRGPFVRFAHCHCSRCRKATGAGHSSNLVASPPNLEWISGQDQTMRFDLPSARSFATAVCRTCGAPVPRLSRDGQRAIIPAGSLDEDPGVQPTMRIFWESRAAWSCSGDDLARFPESAS
ncbi:MAG TPA: GFA family protein [Candidatus Eisenbacteria bacterium]|nr:GFA family protein [Candidatus Eisenbacteria bacterium]